MVPLILPDACCACRLAAANSAARSRRIRDLLTDNVRPSYYIGGMFSSKVFQEVIGMQRVILTGLLGGVGMFLWLSIAHMVLPLGQIGFKQIPNEQAVLAPL